jgi:hypothetical protein
MVGTGGFPFLISKLNQKVASILPWLDRTHGTQFSENMIVFLQFFANGGNYPLTAGQWNFSGEAVGILREGWIEANPSGTAACFPVELRVRKGY